MRVLKRPQRKHRELIRQERHSECWGITDHSCVAPAHETLPWGSHYRNLVTAPGHTWVAYTLGTDTQVQEAAARAQVLAAAHEHDDGGGIPVLDAYSDGGSVLANGERRWRLRGGK